MLRRVVAPALRRSSAFRSMSVTRMAPSVAGGKDAIKLVEAPRDAMQGLKNFVPTPQKVRYIQALLQCGFHTLDVGSFVAAPLVPQMRDTAEVLEQLDMTQTSTKLLVVCANLKGTEKACDQVKVSYVGYPLSASETFQKKNTNRDVTTALGDLALINKHVESKGKELVTFISMGFGNPYNEEFSPEVVEKLVAKVANLGCRTISLADTVGVSEPGIIRQLFTTLIPRYPEIEFGAHFHSGAVASSEKIRAALESGCRRVDHALGGMGGCPFAKSTLVGNVSTESVIEVMSQMGFRNPLDMEAFKHALVVKHDVFGVGMKELLLASVLHDEKEFRNLCIRHFDTNDVNGNGKLELPEFTKGVMNIFSELGEQPPAADRIALRFREMDLMGQDYITIDEYMIGVRKFLKRRLAKELAKEQQGTAAAAAH